MTSSFTFKRLAKRGGNDTLIDLQVAELYQGGYALEIDGYTFIPEPLETAVSAAFRLAWELLGKLPYERAKQAAKDDTATLQAIVCIAELARKILIENKAEADDHSIARITPDEVAAELAGYASGAQYQGIAIFINALSLQTGIPANWMLGGLKVALSNVTGPEPPSPLPWLGIPDQALIEGFQQPFTNVPCELVRHDQQVAIWKVQRGDRADWLICLQNGKPYGLYDQEEAALAALAATGAEDA